VWYPVHLALIISNSISWTVNVCSCSLCTSLQFTVSSSLFCIKFEPRIIQPVTSRYTDRTIQGRIFSI
jgi:hypothetical protein